MVQSKGSIIQAPTQLDISDLMVINNLKLFKTKFPLYLTANDLDLKSDEIKVAILLSIIDDEAFELIESLKIIGEEKSVTVADIYMKKFVYIMIPKLM